MSQPMDEIRRALRQRLEADRLLGAREWPVSRQTVAGRGVTANHARTPAVVSAPAQSERTMEDHAPKIPREPAREIPADAGDREGILQRLDVQQVRGCTRCGLARMRTQTVFGQGSCTARIVFVGEAPGFEEDRTGQAFVGRAGQLLTDMIEKGMRLRRADVYICNVIKCRPPDNRTPAADEIAACSPYLFEQLRVIRPEAIIALGAPAAQTLLGTKESIGRLRGRFHEFRLPDDVVAGLPPIPLMPTYHPAYLLRSPGEKTKAWDDLKKVMRLLGLPIAGE